MNLNVTLTKRESEIAEWIAAGYCKKEIAGKLFSSPRTIENTARNIYKKIGVSKAVEVCIYWYTKNHNIPLSQSPLKRGAIAFILLLIFLPFEFLSNQNTVRANRTECRASRSRRNDSTDYLLEL
jgi:DNA-binding CsgD family transcriptional regulator